MTATDHVRDLAAAVRAAPEDWPLRLVYADALDDAGRHVEAAGQRWQAANEKRPYCGVHWYDGTLANDTDGESDLPPEVFVELAGGELRLAEPSEVQDWRDYLTTEDAELDLALFLASLPEDARG
jgi:uncharacterized protein (TIGR02996 family)